MIIKTFAYTALSAILVAAPALAADQTAEMEPDGEVYKLYGNAGGWEVWQNMSSKGCFLQDRENYGNLVQMGLRSDDPSSQFIGVWNQESEILAPGQTTEVTMTVDGTPYNFEAKANESPVTEGYHGAYTFLNNPAFVSDVYDAKQMNVFINDDIQFVVDLNGTREGLQMVEECYSKMN